MVLFGCLCLCFSGFVFFGLFGKVQGMFCLRVEDAENFTAEVTEG